MTPKALAVMHLTSLVRRLADLTPISRAEIIAEINTVRTEVERIVEVEVGVDGVRGGTR
jgi:hypothetical protein